MFRGSDSESLHLSSRSPHRHDNEQNPPSGRSLTANSTQKLLSDCAKFNSALISFVLRGCGAGWAAPVVIGN